MHKITFDEILQIIIIKYSGNIALADLKNGSREAAQQIVNHKCYKVLVDCRDINFELSTLEIYDLPETFSFVLNEFGLDLRKIKRALLVSQMKDDYEFVETVATNRGYWVKLFDDLKKAKKWLASE